MSYDYTWLLRIPPRTGTWGYSGCGMTESRQDKHYQDQTDSDTDSGIVLHFWDVQRCFIGTCRRVFKGLPSRAYSCLTAHSYLNKRGSRGAVNEQNFLLFTTEIVQGSLISTHWTSLLVGLWKKSILFHSNGAWVAYEGQADRLNQHANMEV